MDSKDEEGPAIVKFGSALRRYRIEVGLTPRHFVDAIGYGDVKSVRQWEAGMVLPQRDKEASFLETLGLNALGREMDRSQFLQWWTQAYDEHHSGPRPSTVEPGLVEQLSSNSNRGNDGSSSESAEPSDRADETVDLDDRDTTADAADTATAAVRDHATDRQPTVDVATLSSPEPPAPREPFESRSTPESHLTLASLPPPSSSLPPQPPNTAQGSRPTSAARVITMRTLLFVIVAVFAVIGLVASALVVWHAPPWPATQTQPLRTTETTYRTAIPGLRCDHGGATWENGTATRMECLGEWGVVAGTTRGQTFAQELFHTPGGTLRLNRLRLDVAIGQLVRSMCGGVQYQMDVTTAYHYDLSVCQDGSVVVLLLDTAGQNMIRLSLPGARVAPASVYHLTLTIADGTQTVTVNGQPIPLTILSQKAPPLRAGDEWPRAFPTPGC